MRFKDIPGQAAIKSYFVDIRKSGKTPHAILISGNPGTVAGVMVESGLQYADH